MKLCFVEKLLVIIFILLLIIAVWNLAYKLGHYNGVTETEVKYSLKLS